MAGRLAERFRYCHSAKGKPVSEVTGEVKTMNGLRLLQVAHDAVCHRADSNALTMSSRPLPKSAVSGFACAMAAATAEGVMLPFASNSSAATPATNGALKEVPQAAA